MNTAQQVPVLVGVGQLLQRAEDPRQAAEALLAQDEQHPSFLEHPTRHENQGRSAPWAFASPCLMSKIRVLRNCGVGGMSRSLRSAWA